MPIIKNGVIPDFIRYVDADGGEYPIIKVTVGDMIIWDGTKPAYPEVTRMVAGGSFRVPVVTAGQSVAVPRISGSTGELVTPAIRAGAAIAAAKLLDLPGQFSDTDLTAAASVLDFESFKATGQAYDVGAGAAEPGAVFAPKFTGTGSLSVPVAAVPIELEVTTLTGVGETYAVTVAGNAAVEVTKAIGSGLVSTIQLKAGQTLTVTSATGTALVKVPVISAGRTLTVAAPFTGAGFVGTPEIRTFVPMGAYLSSAMTVPNYSEAFVTPLTKLPAYPGTVCSGSTITIVGSSSCQIVVNHQQGSIWTSLKLFRNGSQISSTANGTNSLTWNGTVSDGDQIQTKIVYNNGGGFDVTPGTANFTVTINPT